MAVAEWPSEDQPSTPAQAESMSPSPEVELRNGNADHFEPTVGEHVRLGQFLSMLERADEKTLRSTCADLGRLALLTYPAMIRGLAWQAAENLSGKFGNTDNREALAAKLLAQLRSSKPDS